MTLDDSSGPLHSQWSVEKLRNMSKQLDFSKRVPIKSKYILLFTMTGAYQDILGLVIKMVHSNAEHRILQHNPGITPDAATYRM